MKVNVYGDVISKDCHSSFQVRRQVQLWWWQQRLRKPFRLTEKMLPVQRKTHLQNQSESILLFQEELSFCMTSGTRLSNIGCLTLLLAGMK